MRITPDMQVARLGSGQTVPGTGMLGFGKLNDIPDGHPAGSFGGVPVNTRVTAAKNDSTMDHARKPINHTYLVDIDQSYLPGRNRKLIHSASPDGLGAAKDEADGSTTIANGEFNKQDVCIIYRISSDTTGIAYAVKNIGAFNMYMRTKAARDLFGKSRHDGVLKDLISFDFLVQVGNVYKKNFNGFTAYSLEFSTAQYGVVTDVWKACQLQPWHTFTKHTANEGDYVGFALIRMRYEDNASKNAAVVNYDPYNGSQKRRKLNNNKSNNRISDTEHFKQQRGSEDYIDPLTHDDYKHLPLYKRYHYKEFEEELNHEHFWQLVPWISPLASGPYQQYIDNQHFKGSIFPVGQIWETYGKTIRQDKSEAYDALYYLFPWLEPNVGDWRVRSLEHRAALDSNLTLNLKCNSTKLYIV